MKKTYTHRQIVEAISYWKKQLNESNGTYLDGASAFSYGPTGNDIEEQINGSMSIDSLLNKAKSYNHNMVVLASNNDGTFQAYGCNDIDGLISFTVNMNAEERHSHPQYSDSDVARAKSAALAAARAARAAASARSV